MCFKFNQCPFSPTNLLQNLLNVEKIHAIMSFLPIILNQLFKVLVQNEEDEISTTVTRYLSHDLRRWDLIVCMRSYCLWVHKTVMIRKWPPTCACLHFTWTYVSDFKYFFHSWVLDFKSVIIWIKIWTSFFNFLFCFLIKLFILRSL